MGLEVSQRPVKKITLLFWLQLTLIVLGQDQCESRVVPVSLLPLTYSKVFHSIFLSFLSFFLFFFILRSFTFLSPPSHIYQSVPFYILGFLSTIFSIFFLFFIFLSSPSHICQNVPFYLHSNLLSLPTLSKTCINYQFFPCFLFSLLTFHKKHALFFVNFG